MKIKSLNNDNIMDSVRYNQNTSGTHLQIKKGFFSQEKRDFASICLLSLMQENGLVLYENNPNEMISKMNENSLLQIKNYHSSNKEMVL